MQSVSHNVQFFNMTISDIRNRSIVLLAIAASGLLFAETVVPSAILIYFSDILLVSVLLESRSWNPYSFLVMHWRTFFLYAMLIISTVIVSISLSISTEISVVIPSLLLISSILTAIALFAYPIPSLRPPPGQYKGIGTLSFTMAIDNPKNGFESPFNSVRTVQCWFPIKNSIIFLPYSILWTSGNPHTEFDESRILLDAVAANSGLPPFLLRHLSLAKCHSRWQQTFDNIIRLPSDPKMRRFPIAIYSHGMYGWRQIHHSLCEALASYGFVVFSIDHHPDSMACRSAKSKDSPDFYHETFNYELPSMPGLEEERLFYQGGLDRRLNDLTTLINFIESGEIYKTFPELPRDSLDAGNIYAWGHSYGGCTVSALSCKDSRVRAVASLDGWLFPLPDDLRRVGSLRAPLLNLSADGWKYGKFQFPFREDLARVSRVNLARLNGSSELEAPVFDLSIRGTNHQNYCDVSITASPFILQSFSVVGSTDPYKVMKLIDVLVAAFFIRELRKDDIVPQPTEPRVENTMKYDGKGDVELFYSLNGEALDSRAASRGEIERLIHYCLITRTKTDGSNPIVTCSKNVQQFIRDHVFPSKDIRNTFDFEVFRRFNKD